MNSIANTLTKIVAQQPNALHKTQAANQQDVDKVAKDFEAMFISQMLQSMFKDVKTDPVLGGGQSEEVFRSMLIDQYGKEMSQNGGLGLAPHIKAELLRMQEVK